MWSQKAVRLPDICSLLLIWAHDLSISKILAVDMTLQYKKTRCIYYT